MRRLNKRTVGLVFIFLIGLSILLYPVVSSTWNQIIANMIINKYDVTVANQDPQQLKDMIDRAREYNEKLLPKAVPDAFSIRDNVSDLEYESVLGLTADGLMGYIEIPVIDVSSPIYHYTTEEVLQKGVGHLFGSSMPVGGTGSHAVLSAHRGLPNNKLFSDLDKVVVGDRFYIKSCGEIFAYEVDKIDIVEPDQTEGLALFPDKDYVTLVTCTPYGVNTHRILCRGTRVAYEPGEEEKTKTRRWVNMNILTGFAGALFGILLALIMTIKMKKSRDKEVANKSLSSGIESAASGSDGEIEQAEQGNQKRKRTGRRFKRKKNQ